jgi:exodeoxyribonuclease VII large subunit
VIDNERRALESNHPRAQLAAERERIGMLLDRAARVLSRRLEIDRAALDRGKEQLPAFAAARIGVAAAELGRQSASLSALSPYATLERGYSIVRGPDGAVLRDAGSVAPGDALSVRLQRGEVGARVESVRDSSS